MSYFDVCSCAPFLRLWEVNNDQERKTAPYGTRNAVSYTHLNDAWSKFCDRITTGDAWLTEDGFFSSSGYGDGSYGVYAKQKDGKAVALEIRF